MRLSSSKGSDYRITYFNAVGIYYSVIFKQKLDDKVTGLRNDVRDNIVEVKDTAKSTVKQTILYMNERLKDFTNAIDQKLYEHEPVQLDRKQNKAMAAQAHER